MPDGSPSFERSAPPSPFKVSETPGELTLAVTSDSKILGTDAAFHVLAELYGPERVRLKKDHERVIIHIRRDDDLPTAADIQRLAGEMMNAHKKQIGAEKRLRDLPPEAEEATSKAA